MKPRYYLYRMGALFMLDDLTLDDAKKYQGFYCLDMGADLQSPTHGMMLGGRLKELSPDKFPTDFRAKLLVLDVP
jgi:hypothetical protein